MQNTNHVVTGRVFFKQHQGIVKKILFAALCLALNIGTGMPAFAAEDWLVGQVTTLSGTNGAELGQGLALGQKIYFDHINSTGGIHGRKIRLITVDDHYVPEETVKLTQEMLSNQNPIALMGYRGTATTMALVKSGILTKEKIALIGSLTGAKELQGAPNFYQIRTSYPVEIHQMITQVAGQGFKKIGIFYSDDAFGQSGLAAAQDAVRAVKGEIVVKYGYDKSADKVDASTKKGVSTIMSAKPDAVFMIAVGTPAINFLSLSRDLDRNIPLYSLSVVSPAEVTQKLGALKAAGIGFSQVFPYPYSDVNPLASEYRKLLKKYAPQAQPNYFSLEGFVNAKLFVAGLRKAGASATRADLMRALDNLDEIDLGDFFLKFSPNQHSGSRFTELTVISKSGNLIR